MDSSITATIENHFSSLKDPRVTGRTDHKLIDIITITLCAVISGANDFVQIERYAKSKQDWLESFLELPFGIPSHDTFGRVFSLLSNEEVSRCFLSWVQSVFKTTDGEIIPIDGKTLRRSYDNSSNKAAIHMVSAWACKNGMALGQVKTNAKSNEITAIPELLDKLDLKGCIVTIDAMGTQKKIADKIINKEADYVLALKGNQSTIHKNTALFFDHLEENQKDVTSIDTFESVDGDHGRVETRKYTVVSDIDWLQGKEDWRGLKSIGMVESTRDLGDKVSTDRRYYLTSLDCDSEKFAEAVRSHWGVENKLHWVLDISFREDESRIRKGNAAENMAVIRHLALNLLNREKKSKVGKKTKRLMAAWDNEYLIKLIMS
jgi:predicted transposase YbfD/YdcC